MHRRTRPAVPVSQIVLALPVAALGGCGSSSGASKQAPASASVATVEPSTLSPNVSQASSPAPAATSTASVQPCALVTRSLLHQTLGTDVTAGRFEPVTTVGTGCRFTMVGASSSVNILVETTTDPQAQLPELAYSPPTGSSSVPGADRGYVKAPAAGDSTGNILVVKGSNGVFVTIFQNSPALTAASEQNLAAAILARL